MNNEVEEIKNRLDIVEFISTYLTLKKAGVNYKAVCPFHNEKTPSLIVSPEKKIWHCFGCGEGGDIFTFVMKMENLEFPETLKILADRAGVKLERRKLAEYKTEGQVQKSRLYELNNLAARAFNKILTSHPLGKPALTYLKKRKLTDGTIKEYLIGYAPSSRAMEGYLKKHGFTDKELEAAGNPNKFFKRIIFPIRDVMGNCIAFTGRVLDSNQEPKYLNTSETAIFHKSRILYNLEKARGEIRTNKATVVVEGQMDVIASFQANVKNVVATSGTALTPDHLEILMRYTPNIIFSFDSDSAGLNSAKKAYEMALQAGFNVKMVNLGKFKDPGEMIAEDPRLWQEAVTKATSVIDWYFELAFNKQQTPRPRSGQATELTAIEKKEIAKEILPVLLKIPDLIEQSHYVSLLAKKLSVSEQVIFDALEKNRKSVKPEKKSETKLQSPPKLSSDELLIAILLKAPEKIGEIAKKVSESDFHSPILTAIYKSLLKWYSLNKTSLGSSEGRGRFLGSVQKDLSRDHKIKMNELLLAVEDETAELLTEDLDQTYKNMQHQKKENLKNYFAQEIKKAESDHDLNRLKKLIKEFQDAISK